MRRAERRRNRRLVLVTLLAVPLGALASPLVAKAAPSPAPSPSPASSYNPQACNNSTEFTIQFDPATCVADAGQAVAAWVSDQAIQDVASWVTSAAASGSAQLLGILKDEAARPELNAPWFRSVYVGGGSKPGAVVIAAWLMVLVVTGALFVGVIRGDLGGMLRLVAVRLPVAVFITYIATWLVSVALALTDVASSWVLSGGMQSLEQWTGQLQTGDIGHDFLTFVSCLILIVATLLGYLELLARDAAIYIVTAFIPLIAVASLWPGAHNALKRGAETLLVLCLSKLVLVFVLTLGATALAASTDLRSFAPLLTGTLIFLIAALAPGAVFRLIPILEATAVAGMAGGASRFGLRAGRRGHAALGTGLAGLSAGVSGLRGRLSSTDPGRSSNQVTGAGGPPGGLRLARNSADPGDGRDGGPPGGGVPSRRGPSPNGHGPAPAAAPATAGNSGGGGEELATGGSVADAAGTREPHTSKGGGP